MFERYNDANWISDAKYSKSTNRFIFTLKNPLNTLAQPNLLWSLSVQFQTMLEKKKKLFYNFFQDIPSFPKPMSTIYIY